MQIMLMSTRLFLFMNALRKMCEDLGLIKHETITKCLTAETQLNMPQYPPHEIGELRNVFTIYKISKIKMERN